MNARDEILARIQQTLPALPRSSSEDHAAIPRGYIQSGTRGFEERLELFEDRLCDYGTQVYRAGPKAIKQTIALAMKKADRNQLIVADDVERDWLPDECVFDRDADLSYDDLDRSHGILTTCAGAIALTGTIILRHSRRAGRRAITLIPDYHLCIVRAENVVETVPEGIRAIDNPDNAPLTFVSGPSATADIEMTRIKGVHGPRTLDVILLFS